MFELYCGYNNDTAQGEVGPTLVSSGILDTFTGKYFIPLTRIDCCNKNCINDARWLYMRLSIFGNPPSWKKRVIDKENTHFADQVSFAR